MQEAHDRPLHHILQAVSSDLEHHTNGHATEADDKPIAGEVPELGQQAADAVRKATEVSAEDLERAANAMRYAGNRIAADIEMFTSLALLVSTKTRAVTER